jgi:putative membrane protein
MLGAAMADGHGMMDGGHGDRPWGALMLILLVVLIGFGVWAVVRSTHNRGPHPHDRAREILAERLARGEITPEEYRERVEHLK